MMDALMFPVFRYFLPLVALLFSAGPTFAQQSLVIATNTYPPYVGKDIENSFLPALFAEIGREMGVTFELRIMPWKRCEQSVADLDAWGAIPYARNSTREKTFLFSDPLYVADSHFFAYHDPDTDIGQARPLSYEQLRDLRYWRIGGINGYYYQPLFEEAGLNVEYTHSEKQNFQRLKLGRIDLVAAATTVGWHMISELFPPEIAANFYTLPKPLVKDAPLYLMTSKNYPDNQSLLARFNLALNTVKTNGTLAYLVERHGLVLRY